jgi:hypothetical protein
MKLLSIIILTVLALAGWFLFTGCAEYAPHGTISYVGRYGEYSLYSDGKNVTYGVKLTEPRGFAK